MTATLRFALCSLVILAPAVAAMGDDRPVSKAVAVDDRVYIKTRSGVLAMAPFDEGRPVEAMYTPAASMENAPDSWDVYGEFLLAIKSKIDSAGAQSVVYRYKLSELPPVKAGTRPKEFAGERWEVFSPLSLYLAGPIARGNAIHADLCLTAPTKMLQAAMAGGSLHFRTVAGQRMTGPGAATRVPFVGEFVCMPLETGLRLVSRDGICLDVSSDGKNIVKREATVPNATQPAVDQNVVLVVDKTGKVPRCLRFELRDGEMRFIDEPGSDTTRSDAKVRTVQKALDRAMRRLDKEAR